MVRRDVAVADDHSLDRYARLVRRTLGVPVALVTLVEDDRQVFPGALGLPEPWQSARQTPLSHSFCQYVVKDAAPLVVTDARTDARLADNLAIPDLGVIAYAGWPLRDHAGTVIGSVCAIDSTPREWQPADLQALEDLADACGAELAERELRRIARTETDRAERVADHSRRLLSLSEGLAFARTLPEIATVLEETAARELGCSHAGIWAHTQPGAVDFDLDPAASVSPRTHPDSEHRTYERGSVVTALEERGPLRFIVAPGHTWPRAVENLHLAPDDSTPVGQAYRGRRPLLFADHHAQRAAYPDIATTAELGEARAYLPLRLGSQVLGTLALIWPDARAFGRQDRLTIDTLTLYAAAALQRALLIQELLDVSATLQNALLSDLPDAAGLELAARYRPAASRETVGGDWYDAIALRDGSTALVIGDVVGHDIKAAADMGRLRSMLRAFAYADGAGPAATVEKLDRTLRGLDLDAMATLVYATLTPPAGATDGSWSLAWTVAGHPPPLLVGPDGETRFLTECPGNLFLNVEPGVPRAQARVEIPAGATLLLFTDGLVERPRELIDVGLARLAESAGRHHRRVVGDPTLGLEALLDAILGDLLPGRLTDDIAIVAARISG